MTELQMALITTLRTDSGVQTALGSQPSPKFGVAELQNFSVTGQVFPFVGIGITTEKPRLYQQIRGFSGKRITDSYFTVEIFSKKSTSHESGLVDTAIRVALDGSQIAASGLVCYFCEFDSLVQKDRDPDSGLWHTITRYHTIARLT